MNYRILHPTKEGKRKYRFAAVGVNCTALKGKLSQHPNVEFYSADGTLRAWIKNGWIFATNEYFWNGCSPKKYVGFYPLGAWIGTPDFDGSIEASFWHDVLYQFSAVGMYDAHDANYQFLYLMERNGFLLASHYFDAVEAYGAKYFGKDKDGVYVKIL